MPGSADMLAKQHGAEFLKPGGASSSADPSPWTSDVVGPNVQVLIFEHQVLAVPVRLSARP